MPDGQYNIEFKIYDSLGTGTSGQGTCSLDSSTDDCWWVETRTGANTVKVKNGYFSANLGSVTGFSSTVPWDQDLWLSMRIGGIGAPSWDTEMSPRIKLTAVPYAFNTDRLDGIDSSGFAQLTPSSPQVVNSALSALSLNQNGSGALLKLQGDGADILTVSKTGEAYFKGAINIDGASLDIGTLSVLGALVLNDGTNNTGTIQTAALGQNTVYTLPDPGGVSASICLSSGNCAGAGDIRNGGNAFGGLVTIGTNDNFGLAFETNTTTKMTILPNGNIGIAVMTPEAVLEVAGRTATSGSTTMTAVNGTSLFTTSISITLNAGDYIVPTISTAQARAVTAGGTGVTFNVTPAYSAGVTLETFTIYRPISNFTTDSGTSGLFVQGNTGKVGIGTETPLAMLSVGLGSPFQVSETGAVIAVGVSSSSGLIVSAGGASITGGLDNNSGGLTEAGSITGVGTNITASAGLTIASGGSSDLALDSASNKLVIAASDTMLERIASGSLTLNLADSSATSLVLDNAGSGVANLNLSDGGLSTAGTSRLTNGGALENITGLTITSSGANVTGNSVFAGNVDLNGNTVVGNATTDRLTITAQLLGQDGLVFQGATDNGFASILRITDPTANRIVTLADEAGTICLRDSLNCGFVLFGETAAQTDSSTDASIFINKTGASGNILTLQKSGAGVFTIANNGAVTIASTTAGAFSVTDASALNYFSVDTSGSLVRIGSATADGVGALLIMDTKNTTGDPAIGSNTNAQYYNSFTNKFRCY
ncbi:MAG: hypothetical protein M3Q70_03500, partial [bacterium]|nr:hypothetical protein [bacterium]